MVYTPPTGAGNVTTNAATSGGTLSTNKPSNLADGDLLLTFCYKQLSGTTFTTPAGFTHLYHAVAAGGSRGLTVFAKPITSASGEGSTYSVTASDTSSRWIMAAARLPLMAATYLDAAPTSDVYYGGATSVVADPAVTAVAASTLALAVNFTNNSTAVFPAFTLAGWAPLVNGNVTSGASTSVLDIEYRELTSAGSTGAQTFTLSVAAASAGGFLLTLALAARTGQPKVWNGTAWVNKPAKVWNGTTWVAKPVKAWDGSAWKLAK